jgi:hypothetical protein
MGFTPQIAMPSRFGTCRRISLASVAARNDRSSKLLAPRETPCGYISSKFASEEANCPSRKGQGGERSSVRERAKISGLIGTRLRNFLLT